MPPAILINTAAVPTQTSSSTHRQELDSVRQFHREILPGYKPSPLHQLKLDSNITATTAAERFKGDVYIKDESNRYGLPAFKVLGAAYASYVALCEAWNLNHETTTLERLRSHAETIKPTPVLVAATDGNHGRAVAFFSNLIGLEACILIPSGVSEGAEKAIDREGPDVTVIRLQEDYDECVKRAASFANETTEDGQQRILIQDTAWEGYTHIPQLIVDGYQTIFSEVEEQLSRQGSSTTHLICPVGVGSLAQAAVQYYASSETQSHLQPLPKRMAATLIAVEPDTAACLAESIAARRMTSIQMGHTIMAGLNCGTPSFTAWPYLQAGIRGVVTIQDEQASRAAAWLKSSNDGSGIVAGPCGAAPLAALQVLLHDTEKAERLGLLDDDNVKVVLLMTEGDVSAL